jgi:hypothetical protein
MDKQKNIKVDKAEDNGTVKEQDKSGQSPELQEKNKKEILTDEEFEEEKKLHEAETERD